MKRRCFACETRKEKILILGWLDFLWGKAYISMRVTPKIQTTQNWWVWVDLNHRPHPYQGCALTNWATDPIVGLLVAILRCTRLSARYVLIVRASLRSFVRLVLRQKSCTIREHQLIWASFNRTSSPIIGGAMRDRTADLLRARQALSQLSYNPKGFFLYEKQSVWALKNFALRI